MNLAWACYWQPFAPCSCLKLLWCGAPAKEASYASAHYGQWRRRGERFGGGGLFGEGLENLGLSPRACCGRWQPCQSGARGRGPGGMCLGRPSLPGGFFLCVVERHSTTASTGFRQPERMDRESICSPAFMLRFVEARSSSMLCGGGGRPGGCRRRSACHRGRAPPPSTIPLRDADDFCDRRLRHGGTGQWLFELHRLHGASTAVMPAAWALGGVVAAWLEGREGRWGRPGGVGGGGASPGRR